MAEVTEEDYEQQLAQPWEETSKVRRQRLESMRERGRNMVSDIPRYKQLNQEWEQGVQPHIRACETKIRAAKGIAPASRELAAELRQTRWCRLSRNWRGICVRGRVLTLQGTLVTLKLAKILAVVVVVVFLIYNLLNWIGGLWF